MPRWLSIAIACIFSIVDFLYLRCWINDYCARNSNKCADILARILKGVELKGSASRDLCCIYSILCIVNKRLSSLMWYAAAAAAAVVIAGMRIPKGKVWYLRMELVAIHTSILNFWDQIQKL